MSRADTVRRPGTNWSIQAWLRTRLNGSGVVVVVVEVEVDVVEDVDVVVEEVVSVPFGILTVLLTLPLGVVGLALVVGNVRTAVDLTVVVLTTEQLLPSQPC